MYKIEKKTKEIEKTNSPGLQREFRQASFILVLGKALPFFPLMGKLKRGLRVKQLVQKNGSKKNKTKQNKRCSPE